jgi:hypothetical protein
MIGQVTAVISPSRRVALAMAPSTDQASGAWPCSSSQGEKWSEIAANSKPASSAALALRTRVEGPVLLGHQLVAELDHHCRCC